MFFDSHCHLTSEGFTARLGQVLDSAREAGVTQVLNIGDSIEASRSALEQIHVARAHGVEMWATAGVHPHNANNFEFALHVTELRELAKYEKVIAIGEIGLDFVYDDNHEKFPGAPRELQEEVLRAQLDIARELDLPVVIHNREADDALLRVIREYSGVRGVFHCFTSSLGVAREVLDQGFYLGFGGVVTFKNAEAVREVARFCPLDRMLIETDAPYLAPVPFRGKTNEPAYVVRTAEVLASLQILALEELALATTDNTRRLFGLAA